MTSNRNTLTVAGAALLALLTTGIAQGAALAVPNNFTAGSPAVAAEVNANFDAVQTVVNDNASRIATLESALAALQTTVSAQATTISSLESQLTAQATTLSNQAATITSLESQISAINASNVMALDSYLTVDIRTLERSLVTLESAADEALGHLVAEAIAGYQTGFLPDNDTPWLGSEQERLRNRFLYVINQAAARLCDQAQWQAAIKCYQSALEAEPLAESFYQGLMRCHHHLGQKAQGLLVYRRCREALATGLGIQPSPQTEALQARLHTTDA